MELLEKIKLNAKKHNKRIVLPEGTEERNLRAADIILEEGIAQIILIGSPDEIKAKAAEYGLKNIDKATIVDPKNHAKKDLYIDTLVEIRKKKGLTREDASKLILDPLYLGVMMIKCGDADGEVSGAIHATGDVLRPALQIIKTMPGIPVVSGAFIMVLKNKSYGDDGIMVFADCAVSPFVNEQELAAIAVSSASTARDIACIDPKIALLSFSSKGSAKHELVDRVANATKIAKEMAPDLVIDGELQADAAIVEKVANLKAPGSAVGGKANVLIFPDLASGNIAYKLVQRLADAEAIGPILQGMAAPINDLSRGCSVNDIVNVVAITANQAAALKK
ncbi:MAG: phosphate acetyltransferase [Bacteroidales bacterium]|nr:phosphate acetyltransferase [Bacteroidales bacterium]